MAQLQDVLTEISATLVDLAAAMERRGEASSSTAVALGDLVALLEKRKDADPADLIAAIRNSFRFAPNITVQPATVQVQLQPAPPRNESWTVEIQDAEGKPRGRMQISRTSTPSTPR